MNTDKLTTHTHMIRAFTLIEVLLVIAILAILAAVAIIAINPSKQLASARDAQRRSDVYSILNALHQYAVDHDGAFPDALDTEPLEICRTGNPSCNDMYELVEITDNEVYLVSFPLDPLCDIAVVEGQYCLEGGTGYVVSETEGGRITVSSPGTELGDEITITR